MFRKDQIIKADKDYSFISKENQRIALVKANFNSDITDKLLEGALKVLEQAGVKDELISVYEVPGAFEIPQLCSWLCLSRRTSAITALGAVIKGDTPHFDYVCQESSRGLMDVSIKNGIPLANGILTCNNLQQAKDRIGGTHGHKGEEAAYAMLEMLYLARIIKG